MIAQQIRNVCVYVCVHYLGMRIIELARSGRDAETMAATYQTDSDNNNKFLWW